MAQQAGVEILVLSHLVPSDADLGDPLWHEHTSKGFDGKVVIGRDLMVL